MSLQEEIQKAVTEQVAAKIAENVMEQVNETLKEQWATVISELVAHRKTVKELSETAGKLETAITRGMSQLEAIQRETIKQQKQAAKILGEALKELDLKE